MNPQTRTFPVEARVDNTGRRLRPGLFARAVLATDKVDSLIRVPATAVLSFYGVQKIYAVEGGAIKERTVTLGDRFGGQIEIVSGLKTGEQIAVSQMTRLREGVKVSATPAAAASTGAPAEGAAAEGSRP